MSRYTCMKVIKSNHTSDRFNYYFHLILKRGVNYTDGGALNEIFGYSVALAGLPHPVWDVHKALRLLVRRELMKRQLMGSLVK